MRAYGTIYQRIGEAFARGMAGWINEIKKAVQEVCDENQGQTNS